MTIVPAQGPDDRPRRRYRGVSGLPLNRRVVMKAAAGVAAITAAGGIGAPVGTALAQEDDGSQWTTRSREWTPPESQPTARIATRSTLSDWQSFTAEFPFYAIGVSWPEDVGLWPVVEVRLSTDGETWSETFELTASNDGGGGPDAANERLYSPLIHTEGSQYVQYRTVDGDGVPGQVFGLRFTYIDATDGPWDFDVDPEEDSLTAQDIGGTDMRVPPEIISRSGWGANESYRFDSIGEIWPPEYETVHHIIVHHTATPNTQDPAIAIRSIYYYHAVTQGWGDIGYNYLVDRNGRIYQGRYGGQNVIGGHSYQYAVGSSGISIIGDFQNTPVPDAAVAGVAAIAAWVGRDLDPYGREDFLQAPDLPIISAHRDVTATTCPGNFLYNRLPELRDLVAATLDDLETPFPGGLIIGDRVVVQTGDGSRLNLRSGAGTGAGIVGSLEEGATAFIVDGPEEQADGNWYLLDAEDSNLTGWAVADFLLAAPIPPPFSGDYTYGLNIYAQSNVSVRNRPGLSSTVLMIAQRGMLGFIYNFPQNADGYQWYQVRWQNGTIGWSAREFLLPAPFDENPAGQFDVGDTVEAISTINLRVRPGLAQSVIATVGTGQRLQVTQAPVGVNDEIWYGVFNDAVGGGWAVQSALREVGAPPAGQFEIGDNVRVTATMNLRSSSTTSASVVAVMPTGTIGEVVGGPLSGSGYTWWQLQTGLGTGWAAQNWLEETTSEPPPPAEGKFAIGERVYTTEGSLRMRTAPSTGGDIIAVLPQGTNGTVREGPRTGSGYTWWRLETSLGTGWVAENWLASAGDPGPEPEPEPEPEGKFAIGEGVRATENLNMRSGASTTSGVVTVLPAGTTGRVVDGPRTGSGYTWWRIETSLGTGWVAENWLVSTGSTDPGPDPEPEPEPEPDGKFSAGERVYTTEGSLRLRSAPSTGGSILAVLPQGTNGTVLEGPRTGSGYTWWRIETSLGTGWVAENWLASGTSGSPSGKFTIGETVQVTENLNMRSGPSTTNGVVAVLPAGTTGTVTSGPRTGSGYTWWQLQTSRGTGWCVENWLT